MDDPDERVKRQPQDSPIDRDLSLLTSEANHAARSSQIDRPILHSLSSIQISRKDGSGWMSTIAGMEHVGKSLAFSGDEQQPMLTYDNILAEHHSSVLQASNVE